MRYHYEKNESGSSGGLMLSLSMYNSLVEEDITKGMRIAGTGTIEYDGSVGEIAGVKYKIMGASDKNVDLFIVPRANYEEAKQVIEENHYNIKLMIADTFEQVLNDLKNYN
jgi:PDZ domain-containing protein